MQQKKTLSQGAHAIQDIAANHKERRGILKGSKIDIRCARLS